MGLGLWKVFLWISVALAAERSPAKCRAAVLIAEHEAAHRAEIAALKKRGVILQGVAGFEPGAFANPITDFTGVARNKQFLEHYVFKEEMRTRGIDSYEENLGPGLKSALATFPRGGHWVDMGAGEFAAQREFFAKRPDVKLTAISIINPQHAEAQRFARVTSQASFRFLLGAVTDHTPAQITGFGQADLITDVYGALTYEARVDEYLKIATAVLKKGGILLLHRTKFLEFVDERSFKDWILKIDGLEPVDAEELGTTDFIRLVKVSNEVNVPLLELVKFVPGSSRLPIPWRVYRY